MAQMSLIQESSKVARNLSKNDISIIQVLKSTLVGVRLQKKWSLDLGVQKIIFGHQKSVLMAIQC